MVNEEKMTEKRVLEQRQTVEEYCSKGETETLKSPVPPLEVTLSGEKKPALLKRIMDSLEAYGITSSDAYLRKKTGAVGESAAKSRTESPLEPHQGACAPEKLSKAQEQKLSQLLRMKAEYRSYPPEGMERDCSMVWMEDDLPKGCLLVAEKEGELTVEFAWADPFCRDRHALLKMAAAALKKINTKYPRATPVHITSVEDSSQNLLWKLFDALSLKPEEDMTLYRGRLKQAEEQNRLCRDCEYRLPAGGDRYCRKYEVRPGTVKGSGSCPVLEEKLHNKD